MKVSVMSEEELVELSRRALPPRDQIDGDGFVEGYCEVKGPWRIYDDSFFTKFLVLKGDQEETAKRVVSKFSNGSIAGKFILHGEVWTLYDVRGILEVEGPGWKAKRIGPKEFRVEIDDE